MRLRVLIVEDSEDDALLVLRELRKGGYELLFERVETRQAMETALQTNQWDLVISDYVLPRFSGLEALNLLKESGQDLPFIVFSGNIGEDIAVEAMKAGAHDYILKDNLTRLVAAAERELREAEVRRKRRQVEEALQRSYEELERRVEERTAELAANKIKLERLVLELERSNRDLEQFAYVASHDLQEPLRMVSGFMQLLEKRYAPMLDEKAREYIHYAVDGAERMSQLVRDLLLFSRVRFDTREPALIDMNKVFDQVVTTYQSSAEKIDARITREHLPVVRGEAFQLRQLLQNLIGNAIKFHRPGVTPEVHVSAEKQGETWLFAVRDNGIGIPPEHSKRIFQIFQRLHDRRQYEGTGIGLAICQRIVDLHGGQIRVQSSSDHGSTFFFELPAVD